MRLSGLDSLVHNQVDDSMNGKGDTQRPRTVSDEEWAERWKRVFRAVRDERLAGADHRRAVDQRVAEEAGE